MTQFNVIRWDINSDKLVIYDVLPYFREEYRKLNKRERPINKEQWRAFIEREGKYRFWSRCEYEIIISSWPPRDKSSKVDVWFQINNNIDLLINVLMMEFSNKFTYN